MYSTNSINELNLSEIQCISAGASTLTELTGLNFLCGIAVGAIVGRNSNDVLGAIAGFATELALVVYALRYPMQ